MVVFWWFLCGGKDGICGCSVIVTFCIFQMRYSLRTKWAKFVSHHPYDSYLFLLETNGIKIEI